VASNVPWIQADEDWPRLINEIDCVEIAITRDFLEEHRWCGFNIVRRGLGLC
jgi:hypothetical protein